jgi:TP901 family phage tail tape measure protein
MILGSLGGSGGGSTNFNVGFRIYLKDNFSGPASAIKEGLKDIKDEYNAFTTNLRAARDMYGTLAAAGALATNTMMQWVKEGADYNYMMKYAEVVTRATVEEMSKLDKLTMGLSERTMYFPEDLASGVRFMGMAGQEAKDILDSLQGVVNLAAAQPGLPIGGRMGAADIITNIIKGFNMEAKETTKLSDMMVAAVTRANVQVSDLGHSLKYAAATATDLNVPVQDAISVLMALGNAGIQASMAGTALENMLRYMTMAIHGTFSTQRQRDALAAMGLTGADLQDARGNLLPLVDILGMMKKNLEGMGTVDVQGILKEVFGVRGKRGGSVAIRELESIKHFQNMLENSEGAGDRMMSNIMDTLKGTFLILQSVWKAFKVEYSKALEPLIMGLNKVLTVVVRIVRSIAGNPIGKAVLTVSFTLITIKTVLWAIKAVVAMVGLTIGKIGVSIKAGNAALKAQLLLYKAQLATLLKISQVKAGMVASSLHGGMPYVYGSGAPRRNLSHPLATHTMVSPGIYREKATGRMAPQKFRLGNTLIAPIRGAGGVGRSLAARTAIFGTVTKMAGVLGKIGAFMFGPGGVAIMMGVSLLPSIFRLFKSSNKTQEDIKDLLKPPKDKDKFSSIFSNREVLEALQVKTLKEVAGLLKTMRDNMVFLLGEETAHRKIAEATPTELAQLLYQFVTTPDLKESIMKSPK